MPAKKRAHYGTHSYVKRSAAVRAHANADPSTTCWRCGLTLEQVRRTKPHAKWDAGHLVDGDSSQPLRAECSSCNRSAGAIMGNAKRSSSFDW